MGRIEGQMAFDRREFGMTHNIPFIGSLTGYRDVELGVRRISGPPVNVKEVDTPDSGPK